MDTTTTHDLVSDGALGIRDAAAWLGISRSRLYELLAEGGIPTLRIGRRRVVPRAALRAFLAERLAEGLPTAPKKRDRRHGVPPAAIEE